jgi:hypothetical protein
LKWPFGDHGHYRGHRNEASGHDTGNKNARNKASDESCMMRSLAEDADADGSIPDGGLGHSELEIFN